MENPEEPSMPKPMQSQFIYDTLAGVPSCHAATLAELPNGDLVAAWFGGARDGVPQVGAGRQPGAVGRSPGWGWGRPST